jgi:hypothetical protein
MGPKRRVDRTPNQLGHRETRPVRLVDEKRMLAIGQRDLRPSAHEAEASIDIDVDVHSHRTSASHERVTSL